MTHFLFPKAAAPRGSEQQITIMPLPTTPVASIRPAGLAGRQTDRLSCQPVAQSPEIQPRDFPAI